MSKAEKTRENIIRQAAELFNQKGYSGSSIADIMQATGLQKGGIYNHFRSKDELALEAFDYAAQLVSQRVWQAVRKQKHAIARLQALISVYLDYLDDPPLVGGCPILNTAIESDDAHPALRDRVRKAVDDWRNLIHRIIQKGIAKGEIQSAVESDVVATIIISTIEGAIMMSKLYGDPVYLKMAIAHLHDYLNCLLA